MPELEIIMKKYPNAILTLNSAFYYYGLTVTIPQIMEYAYELPKTNMVMETIRLEIL